MTWQINSVALLFTGLLTYFVPCYIVGKNAEAVDEGCILHCLAFYVPLLNWYCIAHVRSKIRDRHGIEASTMASCIIRYPVDICCMYYSCRVRFLMIVSSLLYALFVS